MASSLLRTTWPVFAAELAAALAEDGEEQLAEQVGRLRVVGVCRCTEDFCQSFHTAPEAAGGHGEGHRNVWVRAPWPGYLVLDVVADDIVYVEVLYRSPLD